MTLQGVFCFPDSGVLCRGDATNPLDASNKLKVEQTTFDFVTKQTMKFHGRFEHLLYNVFAVTSRTINTLISAIRRDDSAHENPLR